MTAWLNSRIVYAISATTMTAAGAATTIVAPMLLDAPSFTYFALLSSIFSYLSEFDLGLARLSDRVLPSQTADDAVTSAGLLLFARYCVAASLLAIGFAWVSDPLMLVAGAGGISYLLGNGPLSFYRARGNIAGLAFASLLMQFGMTLPRLGGLMIDGVRGSMIGLGLWAGLSCVVLNASMISTVRWRFAKVPKLLARSVPLFLYSAAWLLYQFANRWFSWEISGSPTDAGLFAFGANLTVIAIGVLTLLSQPYYPRHLATPSSAALTRELSVLALIAAGGCIFGEVFCRFALGIVFPHFVAAASVTGALLVASIPLGLSAWLVPLAIAGSNRSFEVIIFPVCLLFLYGLMLTFNTCFGIDGQAWACLPPAMILYAVQLALVVDKGLLSHRAGVIMWVVGAVVVGLGALTWCLVFL
jgi:hypothetical protein